MFIKQSSLCLQAFQDDCSEVTSSGGDVVGHLLCRGGMFFMNGSPQYCHNVPLKKGIICSYILAHPVNASSPLLGTKNVTQYYTPTLCHRYTGVEPDIWLGLVGSGSEAYPMLMGRGSSTRYEEMKQRGTSILKTFIIYSIFSYVQHGRIHHMKHRWSLVLTLALITLTTLLTPL